MSRPRLWIPGPTEVDPGNLEEMGRHPIGHRSAAIRELIGGLKPDLRRLFGTEEVFVMTSSATTTMEAGLRNLCSKRALVCSVGAFGKRWHQIAQANGIESDLVQLEPGQAFKPERLLEHFDPSVHDAVCFTHSETSTGVLNPVVELAAAVREKSDASVLVDAVSALSAVELSFDATEIDLLLAGVQKALALPPGITVHALSARALEKAEAATCRGYTTDFLMIKAAMDKDQTPATPSVSHLYALRRQLARIQDEGLAARAARHRRMSDRVVAWAGGEGLPVLAEEGYRSPTVSCLGLSCMPVPDLLAGVAERLPVQMGAGYGDLKKTHFRIGHMGEHDEKSLDELLEALSAVMKG